MKATWLVAGANGFARGQGRGLRYPGHPLGQIGMQLGIREREREKDLREDICGSMER